jgi:putative ABC transport system permease protein
VVIAMAWFRELGRRLWMLLRRGRFDADLDEEMRLHRELREQEEIERGLSPEEAHYAAQRRFGNDLVLREESRDMWGWNWLESLIQDVRHGLRALVKNPGFTVVAVLTLALGIGANTAIFSVVEAVLIRPLPYPESGHLIWISRVLPAIHARLVASTDYIAWLEQNKTLTGISAIDESVSYNLTGRGVAQRVPGAEASSNFCSTLGVQPFLGRPFTAGEDRPGGRPVVLLTYSFWRRHFNSDRNVLGQTLTLDKQIYTIVGVMPEGFRFPRNPEAELIAPLVIDTAPPAPGQLRIQLLHVMARLKPRVTIAQASADLETISQRLHPDDSGRTGAAPARGPGGGNSMPGGPRSVSRTTTAPRPGPAATPPAGQPAANPPAQMFNPFEQGQIEVVPLHRELVGEVRPALLILLAAVALVLLIACANVANLMLARASARSKEICVRAALGASRLRLLRQLLTESVILGCAGGLVGLLLAYGGVRLISAYTPAKVAGNIFQLLRIGIDSSVLLYTLAVSVLTGVVFGLAPALAGSRPELNQGLKGSVQSQAFSLRRNLLRSVLVVAEISLSLVLLIGAGLLVKSFYQLWEVDPGFRSSHVLAFAVELSEAKYPKETQQAAFFEQLLGRLRVLPGVKAAGLCNSLPLSHRQRMMIGIRAEGQPARPSDQSRSVPSISVSAGYFRAMGIPLVQGRTFTEQDDAHAPKVAILNKTMAHEFFPNENPIGRRIMVGQGANALASVVGVVGDVRNRGLDAQPQAAFFVPFSQSPDSTMEVALLTAVEPTSMTAAVRNAVAATDPEQPVFDISTMDERLAVSVAPQRFNVLLLASFALLAMLLAGVGIYGVVSYTAVQRTHEVGVRMALGAQPRDVLKLILAQGIALLLIGVGVGLIGAFLLTRFLAALLYAVRPTDSATYAAVSLLLAMVAIVACYIPARRATRVDPMVALRYE